MKRSLNDKSALKGSTNDDDKKNNAANDSKKPKLTISNDPVSATTKKTYVKKRKAAGTNNPKLTIKKTSQKQMKSAAAKAATVAAATSSAAATGVFLPTSISPASLIAKPAKSSAGSGQVRSIAPASLTKVASLPSPPSSASSPQLSGVGSGLEDAEPIDLFVPLVSVASMSTPPLDDWATQTADEILAASTADDFFWLSNNDSSDDSITTSAAATGDKNGTTSTSLSLSFDSADVDMDSMADIDFDDVYCFDNDEASDAKYSKQPAADAFEPFCDFDFSLDPPATAATEGDDVYSSASTVSAAVSATAIGAGASADPYGFLDLGITI
ncbi:hypothetical protein D0Z03_001461 [Geotrichum reessii]|nr:hypothetical protein D0Z03_001461 [Galactomyces reessii]